jgi:hypothetical protein
MNKPLLALAGVALLGTAGVASAVVVAPLGGEEEVVSQEQATEGATPTASPQADPEGWVRFSHPGTAEAPPFSFAYPGQWFVRGPELVLVDPPDREPQGTAVWLELFSWDPGTAPSYLGVSPDIPADAMYLKVFVGPYAPLEACGPGPEFGDRVLLDGLDARRMDLSHAPGATSEALLVFAVTTDDCYALNTSFSIDGDWQEIFGRIVDGFRVDESSRVATPTPGPLTPVRASSGSDVGVSPAPAPEGFDTYVHAGSRNAPPHSFAYPSNWYLQAWEAREGSNGFGLSLIPYDPNDPNTVPRLVAGEIPQVNVEIGVMPIGSTNQCSVQVEGAPPAILGTKEGWGFEGRPWDDVISRDVRAEHAGFCFFVTGSFQEPSDPTVFDRITESFRFAE